jgi:drug/metabolite transporter (DMT)-like permease
MSAERGPTYLRGVVMLVASALFLSTSGLALRNIETAEGWQILFYRSLTFSITVFVYLLLRRDVRIGAELANIGWNGLIVAVFMGTGFIAYVFALLHTTVANALFVISAAPLMIALLGWFVLKERVPIRTWVAIGGATVGLVVMVGGGFASGRYLGNIIALWVPVSYAVTVVLIRRSTRLHMLPALCLAGIFATAISGFGVQDFSMNVADLLLSLYLGVFQIGLGFILLFLGARYVPAAQVGLIGLTETICAPIWVWLAVGEVPATATLIGGLIIFSAIFFDGALNIVRSKREQ